MTVADIKRFIRSDGFQKYFQNTSWMFLEKFLRMGISLAVGIYVARYLNPENFGMLNYAQGYVGMFAAFSGLGINAILVRELVKTPDRRDILLGTTFTIKLVGALLLILSVLFSLLFVPHGSLTNTIIIIVATAELIKAFDVVDFYYQSRVLSKYVARVQMVQIFVTSIVKLILIFLEADVIYFAMVLLVDVSVTAIGYIYTYMGASNNRGSIFKWKFNKKLALNLLYESWPITLFVLAMEIQSRIDQVMLGNMIGAYEVGQYSVAFKITLAIGVIPMVMFNSFSPAITEAKKQGPEVYRNRRLNFYRLMFGIYLLVAIPTFFLSETIIVTLFGEEYEPAAVIFPFFVLRLIFSYMGLAKEVFIVNESLFKYTLTTAILGAGLNIVANYFLIPTYASKGAIIASLISFTISGYFLDFFYHKTRENIKLLYLGIFTFWKINLKPPRK